MKPLRQFLIVCLALTIVLTSSAMVVARSQTDSVGSIVICTGKGPMSVAVDADGQPIGPAHICPDCLQSTLDAITPDPISTRSLTLTAISPIYPAFTLAKVQYATQHKLARAPPPV